MKKIAGAKLLKPSLIITLFFGLQFIFWLLFFPEVPTVETGEPKELNLTSILMFLTAFGAVVLGCLVGESAFKRKSKSHSRNTNLIYYRVGVFFLYISLLASISKYEPIIANPSLLLLFTEVAGSNKIHAMVSESSFGIASLQTVWVIPAIIFNFLYFSAEWKRDRLFYFNIFLLLAVVISLSAINSARITLINLLIFSFSIFAYCRKPKISISWILFFFVFVFFIYWLGSIFRDGLVYAEERGLSVYDFDVFSYIFSVFIEKYTLGEFNNALIIMSYDTHYGNFAYGTAFQKFLPASSPDRYLNTFNVFGHWYWQFGYVGLILVSFIYGCVFGGAYKKSISPSGYGGLDHLKIIFFMLYVGMFNATRLNYYFLQLFFVPLVLFISVFIFLRLIKKI